ncbi:hypothetical protein ILYODFUR_019634 [Ilyodon furcidens]|uniref:Uncharacterized protein n=1 Tax=Ilyodon furcidens TaxID=33524 RepID=A0ABV0SYG3_9TELE
MAAHTEPGSAGGFFLLKVRQMMVFKEEVPHDWNPNLDQQGPEPPHIKEEEEELWIRQEGEQFTVNNEDEEKPQLSELHQITIKDGRKIEPEGDDCGRPESGSKDDLQGYSQQRSCWGDRITRRAVTTKSGPLECYSK